MKPPRAVALTGILLSSGLALAEAAQVNVLVERTNAITVGTRATFSSSVLLVSWTPSPGAPTHHFEVAATEGISTTITS